ncbi:MAG: anti sigma factor C-terminal domain-containing protein [Anaerovoracaceae bacterium]|nr:anti-sigma factor C-terminal domain-containing protein [Bacillota bacterium]MDD7733445.1 anti sigma factor C-terminal domain-containing protein [Bacillota bacterium]MDY5906528.1 anti sigma factor C-terminal domain-containing protein [Anaerovoracaceae bacterium]
MTYRQILDKYKKNALPEEKQKEVAADIEKYEAISDYLYEESEIPDINEAFSEPNENTCGCNGSGCDPGHAGSITDSAQRAEDFTAVVNRSIRKAFLKLGITVFAAAALLILFVQFILPGIVDNFYYDPTEIVSQPTDSFIENRMSRDISTYTELVMPETHRTDVTAESLGYGKYNISIHQNLSYTDFFSTATGDVTRGKLRLFNEDILRKPTGNAFGWSQIYVDFKNGEYQTKSLTELYRITDERTKNDVEEGEIMHGAAGSPEQSLETIKGLRDDMPYYAYVTFERMLDFSQVEKIIDPADKDDFMITEPWLAVDTYPRSNAPDGSSYGYITTLPKIGFIVQDQDNVSENEELQQKHFTDMLDYMAEQTDFLKMFDEDPQTFADASQLIKKNGLHIYGMGCTVSKSTMLKLMEFDNVREIYVKNIQ